MPLPTLTLSSAERFQLQRRICYIRWLYEKGALDAGHSDELSRMMAIVHLQTAIESLANVIAQVYQFTGQHARPNFGQLLDTIETATTRDPVIPYRREIERLADIRNKILHQGVLFDQQEVVSAVETCRRFATEVLSLFLHLDFDRVSMVELVEDAWIRARLDAAIQAHRAGDFTESIAQNAIVVCMAEHSVASAFGNQNLDQSLRQALDMTLPDERSSHEAPPEPIRWMFQMVIDGLGSVDRRVNHTSLLRLVDLDLARKYQHLVCRAYGPIPRNGAWLFVVDLDTTRIDQVASSVAERFALHVCLRLQEIGLRATAVCFQPLFPLTLDKRQYEIPPP